MCDQRCPVHSCQVRFLSLVVVEVVVSSSGVEFDRVGGRVGGGVEIPVSSLSFAPGFIAYASMFLFLGSWFRVLSSWFQDSRILGF